MSIHNSVGHIGFWEALKSEWHFTEYKPDLKDNSKCQNHSQGLTSSGERNDMSLCWKQQILQTQQTDCGQPTKPPHEWPALTSPGLVWHSLTGLLSTFQPCFLLARGEWLTVCVKCLSQSEERAGGPGTRKKNTKKTLAEDSTRQDVGVQVALSAAEATAAQELKYKTIYPKFEHAQ